MTNTNLANKAIKAARLAASEDGLGNESAARQAGAAAGRLAFEAGMTCSDVSAAVPALSRPSSAAAWDALVDAWYEAQPKEVTQREVDGVLAALRSHDAPISHDIVARMWTELLRRRG